MIPMHTPEEAVAELHHCAELGLRVVLLPRGCAPPARRAGHDRRLTVAVPGPDPLVRLVRPRQRLRLRPGVDGVSRARVRRRVPRRPDRPTGSALVDHQLRRQPRRPVRGRDVPAVQVAALRRRDPRASPTCRSRSSSAASRGRCRCSATPSSTGRSATSTPSRGWTRRPSTATSSRGYFAKYGGRITELIDIDPYEYVQRLPIHGSTPDERDEFVHLRVRSAADLIDRFAGSFYFGCEADDRGIATAFSPTNPGGARLRAMFSSDIGHWDVPDMAGVVAESFELVEDGVLTAGAVACGRLRQPGRDVPPRRTRTSSPARPWRGTRHE